MRKINYFLLSIFVISLILPTEAKAQISGCLSYFTCHYQSGTGLTCQEPDPDPFYFCECWYDERWYDLYGTGCD